MHSRGCKQKHLPLSYHTVFSMMWKLPLNFNGASLMLGFLWQKLGGLASSFTVLCHVFLTPPGLEGWERREEKYHFYFVLMPSGCGRYPNADYFLGQVPLGFSQQPLATVSLHWHCFLVWLPLPLIRKFTLQTPSWVLATQGQPPFRYPVATGSSLILLCQTINTSHSQHAVLVKVTLK